MDGLKESLEYAVELAKPNVMELETEDGFVGIFSDKKLYPVRPDLPLAREIKLTTLTSLVDYIKSSVDCSEKGRNLLVHVVSPICVELKSELNVNKE